MTLQVTHQGIGRELVLKLKHCPAVKLFCFSHRAGSMDGFDEGRAVGSFQVVSADGSTSTLVQLAHTQDNECGGHILQVSCELWVYNCTGMPLALQKGDLDDSRQQDQDEVSSMVLILSIQVHWGHYSVC